MILHVQITGRSDREGVALCLHKRLGRPWREVWAIIGAMEERTWSTSLPDDALLDLGAELERLRCVVSLGG